MSNKTEEKKRPNKCAVCIDPTAKNYDSTRTICNDCIMGLLHTTAMGTGLTDTDDQLIWITRVISSLRKVLHWAVNERCRLEQMNVKEFLAKQGLKGDSKWETPDIP